MQQSRIRPVLGLLRAIVFLALVAFSGGCAGLRQNTFGKQEDIGLVRRLLTLRQYAPSKRTQQFLRLYDLERFYRKEDPRQFLNRVQQVIEEDPTADKVYAFAELAYLEGRRFEQQDARLALDLYGAAVVHAYQYLFDPQFGDTRNPYDPQFRGACDLYNMSLERSLKLLARDIGFLPNRVYSIHTATGVWNIRCVLRNSLWHPEEFARFEFVSDYEIRGLRNHYRTYGLGVPLIAVRKPYPGQPPVARYYPPNLSFPVTAFLRPLFGPDPHKANAMEHQEARLEFYDPLVSTDIYINGLCVPLQSDLTTPLAYFLSDPRMSRLATIGLFRPEQLLESLPERSKPIMGLYMVQPYEPRKIPVIMIHGLWSSPITWMQMFNDLRSWPQIRANYQFWFYLYPTAQPFWITAAQLRDELAELRQIVDPQHQEPALNHMVLVGHSMGGIIALLQTMESEDKIWRLVSDQPFEKAQADPRIRQHIAESLFFHPNPDIERVITIATPFRGSRLSNRGTQLLTGALIRLPDFVQELPEQFYRSNKDLIRDNRLLRIKTSIEALDPDCPFFQAMSHSRRASWVKYHNIVGMLPKKGITALIASGDGVVRYESAHAPWADSEVVVSADHMTIHTNPQTINEVRRILLEHLEQLRATYAPYTTAHSGEPIFRTRAAVEGPLPLPIGRVNAPYYR